MVTAYKLDCEAAEADCRFIVQSEDEAEAFELARNHMSRNHGKDLTDDELREKHLQNV